MKNYSIHLLILWSFVLTVLVTWNIFSGNNIYELRKRISVLRIANNSRVYTTRRSTTISKTTSSQRILSEVQKKLKFFQKSMTDDQKRKTFELMDLLIIQLDKFNVTYFAYGGTLLGIHRHNGLIPWDDDIDILIDTHQKDLLKRAVSEVNKTHRLISYSGFPTGNWKFYKLDSQHINGKPFKYPYIDIFFFRNLSKTEYYAERESHVKFLKTDLFPSIKRMFNGLKLSTPCNTSAVIMKMYGDFNKCHSPSYNHSKEHYISQQSSIQCKQLEQYFPFVKRVTRNTSDVLYFEETLIKNSERIHTVTYSSPKYCSGENVKFPSDQKLYFY